MRNTNTTIATNLFSKCHVSNPHRLHFILLFVIGILFFIPNLTSKLQSYKIPGTYTFTVPNGVTSIVVSSWGGVGDGGGVNAAISRAGGVGAGGSYAR